MTDAGPRGIIKSLRLSLSTIVEDTALPERWGSDKPSARAPRCDAWPRGPGWTAAVAPSIKDASYQLTPTTRPPVLSLRKPKQSPLSANEIDFETGNVTTTHE